MLLPYRNAAATLEECLASIAVQTCEDYELLAVDDHSGDASTELLLEHAAADPRIRCLSSPRRGLVAALNHGLAAARSALVVRMDADDRMHPERLARHLAHFRDHPGLTLSASRVRAFPEEHLQAGLREYLRWQNACLTPHDLAEEIYVEAPLAHPSVAFRRDVVRAAGGYRDGPFPEDYELWLRLHQRGHRMAKLPEVLLDWREYPQRTSRTDPRYARAAFDRLRAGYLGRDPRLLARRDELVIWGAGRRTRKRCALLLQQGFRPLAWIDIDPRKIGNRLEGVPVCPPAWLERRPRPFVLVYVTNHGARDEIAADLGTLGYRRGRDWLAVG
jgi:cellulose synthase/poly-beta-1,6-N-acetylglucosamine synthase-like glycosyltransferase